MSNRQNKRKSERMLTAIANKAKKDMADWLDTLSIEPTVEQMKAWKAGYIAGINRSKENNDNRS